MSETPTAAAGTPHAPLSGRLLFTMAAAAGVAVANIYYNQPMLGVIEAEFGHAAAAAWIPTATQLGYALSLALALPYGDVTERRRLIVVQFLALGAALLAAGAAPSAAALALASLAVGASASVAQQIVPFAAALAAPERRGKAIGIVLGGILTGILLSRTVSGFVAAAWGWREMFWLGAPLAWGAAALMRASLPACPPRLEIGYARALASLGTLWRAWPTLRRASLVQALVFASFSVFWTILALHLAEPRYGLGAEAAGLFGILGALGIFAAPALGHVADRRGPAAVLTIATALIPLAWAVFAAWDGLAGLAVGILVLDVGMQGALVANQHLVFALEPEARSRLNTILMSSMFLGGALGSAGAGLAFSAAGWPAACALGAVLGLAALLSQRLAWRGRAEGRAGAA